MECPEKESLKIPWGMRVLLFTAMAFVMGPSLLQANGEDALMNLGTYFEDQGGVLKISVEDNEVIWHNGVRSAIPAFTEGRSVDLKVGDSILVGREEGFFRVTLLSLSSQKATFALRKYESTRILGTTSHRPGKLLTEAKVEASLPLMFFDDSEPNRLQSDDRATSRSK